MRCSVGIFHAIVACAGLVACGAASAQTLSVKDVFERYNLIGVYAADCSKPASKDNRYFVNRAIDAGHVQRDEMIGPATREHVTIIDKAVALGPSQISLAGRRDNQVVEGVWRVEGQRHAAWEVTLGGDKLVTQGRFRNGFELPWLNKCGAPAQ